jgi:hypothetical protein
VLLTVLALPSARVSIGLSAHKYASDFTLCIGQTRKHGKIFFLYNYKLRMESGILKSGACGWLASQ